MTRYQSGGKLRFAQNRSRRVRKGGRHAKPLVAGSNDDYYYRFNNSTGARQAIVLTGFFTSFDGGETWVDGQIPMQSGNGAGDPVPAFDAKHEVVMMAPRRLLRGKWGRLCQPLYRRGNHLE